MPEIPATLASARSPHPDAGRIFTESRTVRVRDVDAAGRCWLHSIAEFAQDVARDDAADGGAGPMAWITRRTTIDVQRNPRLDERLEVSTWCSGYGSRWAERRTSLAGNQGARVDTVSLWVLIDRVAGTPLQLPDEFFELWAQSAGNRRVSSRLQLPSAPDPSAHHQPWALRAVDLDGFDHVNNAKQWIAVDETVSSLDGLGNPRFAEIEYRTGVVPGDKPELWALPSQEDVLVWITDDSGNARTTARVAF